MRANGPPLAENREATQSELLSAIGMAQHPSLEELRHAVLVDRSGFNLLDELEGKLVATPAFLEGDQPSVADALLAWATHDVIDLVCTAADRRDRYPCIDGYVGRCLAHDAFVRAMREHLADAGALDQARPTRVQRGGVRVGSQIDAQVFSTDARRAADVVKGINADYKKKETQRQKEKAAAAAKSAAEPKPAASPAASEPAPVFSLGATRIPRTLDDKAKIDASLAMLASAANVVQPELVAHDAAVDAPALDRALAGKAGVPCKNLFLKAKKARDDKDSGLWLVCAPTDAVVDLKALQTALGYKDQLRFAQPDVLAASLDVEQGHVTPLALVNDPACKVNVVLDAGMVADPATVLWFHPMVNTASLGIAAAALIDFVRSTGRVPTLLPFARANANANAVADAGSEDDKAGAVEPLVLTLTHELAQDRVLAHVGKAFSAWRRENVDALGLALDRPKGHGTHNLLLKDSKTKQLYLVCLAQWRHVDMKTIGDKLGAKNLRMAGPADIETAICLVHGCITPLWLYNNPQASVQLVVDAELLKTPDKPLVVCVGCSDAKDHSQHRVVDVSIAQMLSIAKEGQLGKTHVVLELDA